VGVTDVTLTTDMDITSEGRPSGQVQPTTISIVKEGIDYPSVGLLDLVTRLARTKQNTHFKGQIVLQNNRMNDTYTIDIDDAFVHHWTLANPPGKNPVVEKVTLIAKKVKVTAGGASGEIDSAKVTH
jgi:hypothetical protein